MKVTIIQKSYLYDYIYEQFILIFSNFIFYKKINVKIIFYFLLLFNII